ncbi:MAG: phosphodiesterase, partial [Fibrobacter sp.]|nr:phosphodiesterase [Fibrobacter sp.]
MRTLVLSDIHGSAFACKMALSYLDKLKCDRIFLLGDLLYHGPRNPLPGGHDPQGVVELLSPLKEKITAVRGNCDAEVDQMVLGFPCLADYAEFEENGLRLFLSHGHLYDPYLF